MMVTYSTTLEHLSERVSALETARAAQQPATDDEIVEALARIECDSTSSEGPRWETCSLRGWHRENARRYLKFIRADGYDVVKR